MAKFRFKNILFFRLLRHLISLAGIFFMISILVALTTLPYRGYHWLGASLSEIRQVPGVIVLLGGGGMPSESNLIRCWYSEKAASGFPGAEVIIAMPGDITDTASTPVLVKKELEIRGVEGKRIKFEPNGTNTRAQALNCQEMISMKTPVLLVTSPEHMRRAVLCFRKAGYQQVNALPAFENAAEASLRFDDDSLGGNTLLTPDVGNSIQIRYQIWNHLKYEILIAREMAAMAYYRIRGWI